MRHARWQLGVAGILGAAAAALLAAGCGQNTPTDSTFTGFTGDVPEMSIDLAAPDGGLTAAPEKPYFGDPYFSTYLGEGQDLPVADPLASDPMMTRMETRADVNVMYLRILWGNLQNGPEAAAADSGSSRTDWTGGAMVSDGVLFPLRTIAFERGDYIVPLWKQTDPSRQKVEWVSHTGPGKDGVLLAIVIPSATDTVLTSAGLMPASDGLTPDDLFTFKTGPLTISFPLMGIADLDSTVMVDGTNGVIFQGFNRDDLNDLCPRGSMDGTWVRVQNDRYLGGFFRARWENPLGLVVGHVRGRWGVLPEGDRVFVGKIIRRDGSYLGRIRGTWDPDMDHPGHGTFHGAWIVPNRADGRVRGNWVVAPRFDRGGFLRGIWAAACARDSTAG